MPGVPIEQDAAHVEHHCGDRRVPSTSVRTHIKHVRLDIVDVHIRHQMILQALRQRSPVLVGELADALDCSEMTVRRDLESLERNGGLRRVHGGAASVFLSAEETPYGIRALEFSDAKATMTVGQPFPNVWLPNGLDVNVALTLAIGQFDLHYGLDYHDYRQPDVTTKVGIKEK